MKKFLSIVLAAAMVMAMSVTTFASERQVNDLPGTCDIEVGVRLDTDGDGEPDLDDETQLGETICIDLTWPDVVEFIYSMEQDPAQGEFVNVGWQDSDVYLTITNRSTVGVTAKLSYTNLEGFDYGLVFEGTELNNATFDDATNTVVLSNPADSTNVVLDKDEDGNNIMPSAVITVTPDENAAVPEADSTAPVGTITVTISRTPAAPQEPQEPQDPQWQQPPILLYNYYTEENVDVDAEVANRGYYSIGTESQFKCQSVAPVDDTTNIEITNVVGQYTDGADCDLELGNIDGYDAITNNSNKAGTYYVKITMKKTVEDSEPETVYAYLLIKQDAATT